MQEEEILYYNKRTGETAYEPPEGYVDYDDTQDFENYSAYDAPPEGADSLQYDQSQQQYDENAQNMTQRPLLMTQQSKKA